MMQTLAMIGMTEAIVIGLVIVLLFGATKIPALMRGLGQGVSEFKAGLKEGGKELPTEPESSNEKKAP